MWSLVNWTFSAPPYWSLLMWVMGMGAGRAALKNQGQGGQELLRIQCQLLQSPYGSCVSVNPKKQGQSFLLFFVQLSGGEGGGRGDQDGEHM